MGVDYTDLPAGVERAKEAGATQEQIDEYSGATNLTGERKESFDIAYAGTGLTDMEQAYDPFEEELIPLEDLGTETLGPSNVVRNENSTKAMAATAALLSGDVDTATNSFNIIMQEAMLGKPMSEFDKAKQSAMESAQDINKGIAEEILLDEELTDNQKLAAMDEIANPDSPQYDPTNLLSAKMLSLDSTYETEEGEGVRLSMAEAIQTVNAERADMQKLVNAEMMKLDSSTGAAVVDFYALAAPFVSHLMTDKIYTEFKKVTGAKDPEGLWGFFANELEGSQRAFIKEALANAPADKQRELMEVTAKIIQTHTGLPIIGGVDYAKFGNLNLFLTDQEYTDTDVVIDNVVEILDWLGVGAVLNLPKRLGKSVSRVGRSVEAITADAVRSKASGLINPMSPAKTVQESNPAVARKLHEAMSNDESEQVAQALYNTSKQDAILGDILPQVASLDNTVKFKVGDLDLDVSGGAIDTALNTGAIEFAAAEKRALYNKYKNAHENVLGLAARREMTSVGVAVNKVTKESDGVSVDMMYGPADGGWSNAEDALSTVEWAMKDHGVSMDNLTLMRKVGDRYVPTTIDEVNATNILKEAAAAKNIRNEELIATTDDFLVQVKSEYKFKDVDAVWTDTTVKNNLFDMIGAGAKGKFSKLTTPIFNTIQNYILDPMSMVDPTISKSASKAVARSAQIETEILQVANKFAKAYTKLPKKRQIQLESVIKEANHLGIEFSRTKAAGKGLDSEQIQALSDWSRTWDTIFVLENADAVRSLRATNFKEFIDVGSNTKLFAKPIKNSKDMVNPTVYDPTTGKARLMNEGEVEKLYKEGGTLARTKNPVEAGGLEYDLVAISGKKGDAYLRELNNHSEVLQYRKGYYSVKYKDRWFIDKEFKKADGTVYTKAIATAGSLPEAKLLSRNLQAKDKKAKFGNPRRDDKGSDQSDSDSWDMAHNMGRTNQRARGERLGGTTTTGGLDPSQAHIAGPVETMLGSVRSTANRVGMRGVIDTHKARFAKQYKGYLPVDPHTKTTQWPSSISEVKDRKAGNFTISSLGDARTEWNYINYLENGYANYLDESYKALMDGMASLGGVIGSSSLEKTLGYMATSRGPTAFGKGMAFNAYLALNPSRQILIQSHQAVQLAANFTPANLATVATKLPVLTLMQTGMKAESLPKAMLLTAGIDVKEANAMYKLFRESGLVAQIDKQNLVRGGMTHLVDQASVVVEQSRKMASVPGALVAGARKIGFDIGENVNMQTAWLAHYNRAKGKGMDVTDKAVADELTAQTINYTYNMNAAGDMRYNVDSLGLVFQFLQVPHKAFTQMAFNRVLAPVQKGRLAAYNLGMYGVPAVVFTSFAASLFPEDPDLQHMVQFGGESLALNKILNDQVGTESDFSSALSPTGMYGLYETVASMLTTDLKEIWANTPSGKLFVGTNPRITNAFMSMARAFGLAEDLNETPTTAEIAGKDFLRISSGFSNAFKAAYQHEKGRSLSGFDRNITEEDTFRQGVFGIPSAVDQRGWALRKRAMEDGKVIKEDVKAYYNLYKRQLLNVGMDAEQMEWGRRVINDAFLVWGKDPQTLEIVNKQLDSLIRRDAQRGDVSLISGIVKYSGLKTPDEVMAQAHSLPESDAYDKAELIKTFEWMMKPDDGI